MADTEDQQPETEVAEGEAEEAPAARGRLPLIALAAVGLAIGAGTGAMVIGPLLARKMGKAPATIHADSVAASDSTGADIGQSTNTPSVHLIQDLVLNPAGTGGSRFLLLSIAIECNDAKSVAAMQLRDAELRDIILTSLGVRTVEELTNVSERERIKLDIQAAINERFGKKSVSRLYFPQFVVQ